MVHNFIESFNIIQVTIRDKPVLYTKCSERSLREALEILRQHAKQERRIRSFNIAMNKKNLTRKLRHYFDMWYNHAMALRTSERKEAESKISNDKKIELLINAITKKQEEIVKDRQMLEYKNCLKETKSAAINLQQNVIKNKKLSGDMKIKNKTKEFVHRRLEMHKTIIKDQKLKLAEQKKCIDDMKLKEIDKETKESNKATINVAKQVFNQCDERTKRSLIHLMREEGCRDKSLIEIPRSSSPPEFLLRMEARAEARKQRIKQADEIRQRRQEEVKKLEEIRLKEAEEKQRHQQMQVLIQDRKHRKEQEDRRKKILEKNKRLEYLADRFYQKYLLRRYILEPLSSIVEEKHKRLKKAYQHYEETLLIKVFTSWKNEWIIQQQAKLQLACRMYQYNLLWYAFIDWKSFAVDLKRKYQVAEDFYEIKLQKKYVKGWHSLYLSIKANTYEKEVKAVKHYQEQLKRISLCKWKQYMLIADDIKEREQRRDEWRDLIKRFIPDAPKLKNASFDF